MLHGLNLGILSVLCGVLLCWVSLIGVLDGGFLLHGPNLGIVFVLFLFCDLLCWVSFIGVLHGGLSVCMALIWAVCVVSGGVTPCAGSPSLVYCARVSVSVVCVWFCVSVVCEGVCSIFGVCVLILVSWGSIPQQSWRLVALGLWWTQP